MVKCDNCGFLTQVIDITGEAVTSDQIYRATGSSIPNKGLHPYPICQIDKWNLKEELQNAPGEGRPAKILSVIQDERECDGWMDWYPELAPAEHMQIWREERNKEVSKDMTAVPLQQGLASENEESDVTILAVEMIDKQLAELKRISQRVKRKEHSKLGRNRIERWRSRTSPLISDLINPQEASSFLEISQNYSTMDTVRDFQEYVGMFQDFLHPLKEELEQYPEKFFVEGNVSTESVPLSLDFPPPSDVVFIVHGHDGESRLILEKLLKERWSLTPVVLQDEPGQGRTLIEKFEDEALRATYAFVIFSPDDSVKVNESGHEYTQARPNVIFELGWFYGRLGRDRVCLVFKKGTAIPSDLSGISYIAFDTSIDKEVLAIERELKAARMIS